MMYPIEILQSKPPAPWIAEALQHVAVELQRPQSLVAGAKICINGQHITLQVPGFSDCSIDFHNTALQRRAKQALSHSDPLLRSCNLYQYPNLDILDATAGYGEDSYLLAARGATVTALERHPVLYLLLFAARQQALLCDDPASKRMKIHFADACQFLKADAHTHRYDVVYLDPMFPTRRKSALVNADLRRLQKLMGTAPNNEDLIAIARNCAKQRVVVKKPVWLKESAENQANYQLNGKTTRFEIYLPN